jgi:hypothetical protein
VQTRRQPALRRLLSRPSQHRAGEINAEHARGAARSAGRSDRNIAGAGAHVKQRFTSRKSQRLNRTPPPVAIETGREHAVQQIVTRRNRVEHTRDAIGRLVEFHQWSVVSRQQVSAES